MKHAVFCIIMTLIALCLTGACAESSSTQSSPTYNISASANGYSVQLIAAHRAKDSKGNPIAAVEMVFTNKNSDSASFMSCAKITGSQNGVELHEDEMSLGQDYDWDSYSTEVKDGASVTVFRALPLQNTNDPILISIEIIDSAGWGRTLSSVSFPMKLVD